MRHRIDEQQSETGSQGQQEERNRSGGDPACNRQPQEKPVARVLVALLAITTVSVIGLNLSV